MHPSTLAKRVCLFSFLFIIAFYFYGVGSLPLLGPDEPRYAQVAREMFLRGDPITPTLGGHTWFEKPALLYWLMMAGYKIFGVNEFGARVGPALCGLLTIVAVWFAGRAVERNSDQARGFGFWAMLISASSLGLIVFARAASFDVVITMTTTWSLSFFLMHELAPQKRNKKLLLAGFFVFVGFSLLAKGLIGVVLPLGVVGFYYLFRRAWPERDTLLSLSWGIPLAMAVAALWYGPVIARHGWSFIDEFFVQHHFARYVSNKYHHPQPVYFYPAIVPLLVLPWTAFLVDALVKAKRWEWRSSESTSIVRVFSLAWLAMPIVFFSFSGSKLPGYILPALPAAALLIADRVLRFESKWPLRVTSLVCLVLGSGSLVYAFQSRHVSLVCAALIAAPMFVVAVWVFLRASLLVIAGATFAIVLIILSCAAAPVAQRESVRDLLRMAGARGYADAPVLAQRSDDRSAQFYAHERVIYNAEGEVVTFDEVSRAQARTLGSKLLVLISVEYVEQFRNSPGIEVLGDNGRTALLGWRPFSEDSDQKNR